MNIFFSKVCFLKIFANHFKRYIHFNIDYKNLVEPPDWLGLVFTLVIQQRAVWHITVFTEKQGHSTVFFFLVKKKT